MIGKRIGDWTVVAEQSCKIKKFKLWLCRCKCGFERTFSTSYLNTGTATCCDCCKKREREKADDDIAKAQVGRKYGHYTVVKYAGKNKYGSRQWLCRCECGNERVFLSSYLFGNGERRATQCPQCYNANIEIDNRITDEIPDRFWSRFLYSAARRGIFVDLTREEALEQLRKQKGLCALSGQPLWFTKLRTNFTRYTSASIDRIDSSKPYSKDNVQWVHKKINIMKNQLPDAEFIEICRLVTKKAG